MEVCLKTGLYINKNTNYYVVGNAEFCHVIPITQSELNGVLYAVEIGPSVEYTI